MSEQKELCPSCGNVEQIHVIEKSAYDKAVEALKVISQYTSAYSGLLIL